MLHFGYMTANITFAHFVLLPTQSNGPARMADRTQWLTVRTNCL